MVTSVSVLMTTSPTFPSMPSMPALTIISSSLSLTTSAAMPAKVTETNDSPPDSIPSPEMVTTVLPTPSSGEMLSIDPIATYVQPSACRMMAPVSEMTTMSPAVPASPVPASTVRNWSVSRTIVASIPAR